MKPWRSPALLLLALALAWLWLRQHDARIRDDERTAQRVARQEARLAELADSQAAWTAALEAEQARIAELARARAESEQSAVSWALTADSLRDQVDSLLAVAVVAAPHLAPIGQALEAERLSRHACEASLGYCDSTVAAKDVQLEVLSRRALAAETEMDSIVPLWRAAEQRGRDRPWGLGVTAGYGVVRGNDGVVRAGPSLTLGLTYRVRFP